MVSENSENLSSNQLEQKPSPDNTAQNNIISAKEMTVTGSHSVSDGPKVSALSLSSIKAKREMIENAKGLSTEDVVFERKSFGETDMLLHWTKYADRLGERGQMIMQSLLLITDPKLEGTKIIHELPNDGSRIEFESEKMELLGYLRGKLHNHDITIEVVVNESVEKKFAFTPKEKYNRMKEINPAIELLRKTFDLDI